MTIISTITAHGGILVAHDGSSGSNAALLAAIRCAPSFGYRIEVVRAWTLGSAPAITFLESGHVSHEDF